MMKQLGLITATAAAYLVFRRTANTFRAINAKRQPLFYYTSVDAQALGIPVFTYHSIADRSTPDSVTLAEFECQMRYLVKNGYHTLAADEFYDYLVHGAKVPPRSVVITFDDGRATLWTIAFPILQKYQICAICFLVPGIMHELGIRPNLNQSQPHASNDLLNADLGETPMITWEEACIMHRSGLVDFQSHTLHHTRIFTSPVIVNFVHPAFQWGYSNFDSPLIRDGGQDCLHSRLPLGTPIYQNQSRMSAGRRFFDDEKLRAACVGYVRDHGGEAFFVRRNWRSDLVQFVSAYRRQDALHEGYESEQEQTEAIRHSLIESKRCIEAYLPNHKIRYLCYPWHRYSTQANCLAREAGYVATFLDINPQKIIPDRNDPYFVQRILPTNEAGDDPCQITRIDARNNLILSLPGRGRLTYMRRIVARLLKRPGFPG